MLSTRHTDLTDLDCEIRVALAFLLPHKTKITAAGGSTEWVVAGIGSTDQAQECGRSKRVM